MKIEPRVSDPNSETELLEDHFNGEQDGEGHVEICPDSVVSLVFLFPRTLVELRTNNSKSMVADRINSVTESSLSFVTITQKMYHNQ